MIKTGDISERFSMYLRRSGWYPGRCVDIRNDVKILEAEGFISNQTAISILESFAGLFVKAPPGGISPYPTEILFDPVEAASGELDRTEPWTAHIGSNLFPIAEDNNGSVIWVAGDGKFYIGREFGLYFLGNNTFEAMDARICPQSNLQIVSEE